MNNSINAAASRRLTFREGGWVLWLAALFTILVLIVVLTPAVRRYLHRPPGDGEDPRTYGFDLSTSLVPVKDLIPAQRHRDVIPALIDPAVMPASKMDDFNDEIRGKYLVPDDLVIGVEWNGESRAYPLIVMQYHEIANDALGGEPILVTYHPLCDSVRVFERLVRGEVREFASSGLVYNSNHVLYDRRRDSIASSLYSPLLGRAIAGPDAAAEVEFEPLPAVVTTWRGWSQAHPQSTVLAVTESMLARYKELNYESYRDSEKIHFPIANGSSTEDGLPPKQPCVIVHGSGSSSVYPVSSLIDASDDDGDFIDEVNGEEFRFHTTRFPDTVTVTRHANNEAAVVTYAYWFAWHAMHPDDERVRP